MGFALCRQVGHVAFLMLIASWLLDVLQLMWPALLNMFMLGHVMAVCYLGLPFFGRGASLIWRGGEM